MIHFLVTRSYAGPIASYLETWGRDVAPRLRIVHYETLPRTTRLGRGTYVFSDLERLAPAQLELARLVCGRVRDAGCRILNDPSVALRRYDLSRRLHEEGVNDFRAYRLDECPPAPRFPVFLRGEDDHDGSMTDLIHSRQELDQAIAGLRSRSGLLVVEYCHTAETSGIYRKYSAMKVGEAIVPRHVLFTGKWVSKYADLVEEPYVREEADYLRTNPHEAQLRRIFGIAGIDFGRVDYGVAADGSLRVWEINTNPNITVPPAGIAPARLAGQSCAAKQITSAMAELDGPGGEPVRLSVPAELQQRLGIRLSHRLIGGVGRVIRGAMNTRPGRWISGKWGAMFYYAGPN